MATGLLCTSMLTLVSFLYFCMLVNIYANRKKFIAHQCRSVEREWSWNAIVHPPECSNCRSSELSIMQIVKCTASNNEHRVLNRMRLLGVSTISGDTVTGTRDCSFGLVRPHQLRIPYLTTRRLKGDDQKVTDVIPTLYLKPCLWGRSLKESCASAVNKYRFQPKNHIHTFSLLVPQNWTIPRKSDNTETAVSSICKLGSELDEIKQLLQTGSLFSARGRYFSPSNLCAWENHPRIAPPPYEMTYCSSIFFKFCALDGLLRAWQFAYAWKIFSAHYILSSVATAHWKRISSRCSTFLYQPKTSQHCSRKSVWSREVPSVPKIALDY